MPRKRRIPKTRRRRDVLTHAESWELRWGCFAPPRQFADEEDRQENWRAHRDALLAAERPGEKPSAYWRYDVPSEEWSAHFEAERREIQAVLAVLNG
jgi:hypothetical protein